MTIANVSPRKEVRSRRGEQPVDEKSPLLPKNQEDVSFDEFSGASFSGAVFNLSTTIVGAGIMALPATMKILGLIPGVLLIIFIAFLSDVSIEFLIRFSRAGSCKSYGELMEDSFGRYGRALPQVSVLITNTGVLIVYMIIIGDVLSGTSASGVHHLGVLEGWFGQHWWNSRTFILIITTVLIFAPLASFKRMGLYSGTFGLLFVICYASYDSLRFTSALSVGLALVFLVITMGMAIFKLINGSILMPRLLPDITNWTLFGKLFTTIPVFATAYTCQFNVHSIDNELVDSTQIKPVVRTALALCATVYTMISIFGFLLFGDATLDDMLANFDTDLGVPYSSVLNDAVRISYAAHIIFVFPIVFHPLRLSLDGLLFPDSRPLYHENGRFAFVTAGLIGVIFVGANFIPSIWIAFQFTGATATMCLAFIFPASIILRDQYHIATKKDKWVASFMIALAVFSSLMAIYSDLYAVLRKN